MPRSTVIARRMNRARKEVFHRDRVIKRAKKGQPTQEETDAKNNEAFWAIINGKRFLFFVGGEEVVGCGKSSCATSVMIARMIPPISENDLRACDERIAALKKLGYTVERPQDIKHLVYCCDDKITANETGYEPTTSLEISFDELALPDGKNNAQFLAPCSWTFIDEIQNKADARDWASVEKSLIRMLNIRRKHELNFVTTAPLYNSVELRFRQMPDLIIEMHGVTFTPGNLYELATVRWKGIAFKGYKAYERYLATGDEREGTWIYPSHKGDIFKCFDTNSGEHEFLYGINEKGLFYAKPASQGGMTAAEAYQKQCALFAKRDKDKEAKEKKAS